MSFAHFVLRYTGMANGVGGATWLNSVGICRVLAMSIIFWVYSCDLMCLFLLCTHSIWMAWFFVLGSIRKYGVIVGSS